MNASWHCVFPSLCLYTSAAHRMEKCHAFQSSTKWDDKPHPTVVPWGGDEREKKQLSAAVCFEYLLVRKVCLALAREGV